MELFILVIIVILIWLIIIFNNLIRDKNRVRTAWSDIDVQLKRRHDLIPKLVEAVKQYADYESATIHAITELRTQSENVNSVSDISSVESRLGDKMQKLIAIAEDYPELKTNQSFLHLQNNFTDIENHIQYARRYYNGAVRNLNIRIESFPDMIVSRLFGFIPADFFDFEE